MALAKPDIKRTALIVVDMQEDFCPPVWNHPDFCVRKVEKRLTVTTVWITRGIGRSGYSTSYQ